MAPILPDEQAAMVRDMALLNRTAQADRPPVRKLIMKWYKKAPVVSGSVVGERSIIYVDSLRSAYVA